MICMKTTNDNIFILQNKGVITSMAPTTVATVNDYLYYYMDQIILLSKTIVLNCIDG
jgi:hypothetical protein